MGESERRVYLLVEPTVLLVERDSFFTLRLRSCTAVNMMDNVSGRGLLGVICRLHHPLRSAETDEKRPKQGN